MNKLWLMSLVVLLLIGCGGGGDGDSSGGNNGLAGVPADVMVENSAITFTAARNAPLPSSQITGQVYHPNVDRYELWGDEPSWLGTSFDTPQLNYFRLKFRIWTTNLAPGTYSAPFKLVAIRWYPDGDRVVAYQNITVTYHVVKIGVSESNLRFRMVEGGSELPAAAQVSLYGEDISWSASSNVDWLDISPTSGATASGIMTIGVGEPGSALEPGEYTGMVTVQAGVMATDVEVTLIVDSRRIYALHNGIALSSMPSQQHLTQATTIVESSGTPAAWSASTTDSWLKLSSATGLTGDTLTLTADPAGLPNGLYYGSVEIVPESSSGIKNTETIRVGLYVSDQDPLQGIEIVRMSRHLGYATSDPIRPHVYEVDVEGAMLKVGGYNIYTGAALPALETGIPTSRNIKNPIPSSDGSYLYVIHSDAYDESDQKIITIDLDTGYTVEEVAITDAEMVAQCEGTCSSKDFTEAVYARPDGYGVLVTNTLTLIDPDSGRKILQFEPSPRFSGDVRKYAVQVTPDGNTVFFQGKDWSSIDFDANLIKFRLEYGGSSGGGPFAEQIQATKVASGIGQFDLVLNRDGTRLCSLGSSVACYDTDLNPVGAALTFDDIGSFYGGVMDFSNILYLRHDRNQDDIHVFDSSLNWLGANNLPGVVDWMRLSGDGQRIIVGTKDYDGWKMYFLDSE